MPDLKSVVRDIAEEMRKREDRGEVAAYIPELARVDPKNFGLAVAAADGRVIAAGDCDTPFSIQSISKVFTLTLALGKAGDRLWRKVGREPSGNPFNSIIQLELENGVPRNPFINAGAIAVTDSLLSGHLPRAALGEILRFSRAAAEDESIFIDQDVAQSEQRTGFRNIALANFLKSFGLLENPVEHVLGTYFHHCAIAMSCRQLALAGRYPRPFRAQSLDRLQHHFGGACAAHQRLDADLRPLRRLGRIRLQGGTAGQERRRRRHIGGGAGQSLDRGHGRPASTPWAIPTSAVSRWKSWRRR